MGFMSAERRVGLLLIENHGPQRGEFPVDEHEILEHRPGRVGVTRYVEDRDGRWWAAGWIRTDARTSRAVAWPHDRFARLVGRGRVLVDEDCAATGAYEFEGANQ
jgi:hypothetical protein